MHVRVRLFGKPDSIVVVDSKLTKIEQFRRIIKEKFGIDVKLQRLLYGGKLLEDGYTFHDYNIKLNDVIQLMAKSEKEINTDTNQQDTLAKQKVVSKNEDKVIDYKEADSSLYAVGDLIDMRDREQGAWFEGKIVKIVYDPDQPAANKEAKEAVIKDSRGSKVKACSDSENEPPVDGSSSESVSKTKQKGIAKYFTKISSVKKQNDKEQTKEVKSCGHERLLFKVQLDADEEDSNLYCTIKEIRPRARTVVDVTDLKVGQTVMINHNTEDQFETGYWYDFTVSEIKKLRTTYELIGTLYLGPESIPQNDTKVKIHDKIFGIEDVVPLQMRTEKLKTLMVTQTEKRSAPLNCLTCRDDEDAPCKDCGCYLCSGKEHPEKIVLCDECNKGFHMVCLNPPLTELPEEDWYCPSCRRDPNDVIAPGAAKQAKKASVAKSSRDWGRGMACVGKTKTCAMPANHFGPIPGIEVGMCWRFRIQLSESGVHRPPVSGIHGRDVEGAYSIVLSGGYEDDVDKGIEFTYTGSGGRDLSGNKRTAEQSCDQTLSRENKALARNCAVKQVSDTGGDAGEDWRKGKPVRVVRSYKMLKHFPKYAPKEGIRYDGIYKVVKYYPETGLSGFRVWKYLLRRDDPCPAPWEPGANQYSIVYPDGYLEAEAEKKAQKENLKVKKGGKKRALQESNRTSDSEGEASPPGKKRKTSKIDSNSKKKRQSLKNSTDTDSPKKKIPSIFKVNSEKPSKSKEFLESAITAGERDLINKDTLNVKLWQECLDAAGARGKKDFVEQVTQVFLCIICQEVTVNPVTTPCVHNFCIACLKLAFKSTGARSCPCCRQGLASYEPTLNEDLQAALQCVMPGYDAGKK